MQAKLIMSPLISIIIPTYNRAEDLRRALQSVFDQTLTDWEVVVVDNHSIDNTDSLIESFNDPKIRLFKIHNEGVIAASRNLGLKHALGEYIAFLDSDDWWHPQKLEVSLKYLERGADVVFHDLFRAKKANQRIFWKKVPARNLKSPIFDDLVANGNALPNSSVVVRKQVLDVIKGLDEDRNLIAAEDYDAWLRVAKISEKFAKIPQTLGYYWCGGGNISNPSQVLKNLDALSERYSDSFLEFDVLHSNSWLYAQGRSYYLLGSYKKAKKYLISVTWYKTSFSVIYVGWKMLLLINFFYLPKYWFRKVKTCSSNDG
jgi:glycosyltransferase involved in cell wall biosynthesis